jgi:hypothetical protein
MLSAWVGLGTMLLFVLSRTTAFHLMHPRYLLYTAPAAALLCGSIVRLPALRARQVIIVVAAMLSVGSYVLSARAQHGDDWRGAMAALREEVGDSDVPVLVPSCFIEAQRPEHLNEPRWREALFAPESFYPPAGRMIRLTYVFDEAHLAGIVNGELAGARDFLMLTCGGTAATDWLTGRARDRGLSVELIGNFRGVELRRFTALSSVGAAGS